MSEIMEYGWMDCTNLPWQEGDEHQHQGAWIKSLHNDFLSNRPEAGRDCWLTDGKTVSFLAGYKNNNYSEWHKFTHWAYANVPALPVEELSESERCLRDFQNSTKADGNRGDIATVEHALSWFRTERSKIKFDSAALCKDSFIKGWLAALGKDEK